MFIFTARAPRRSSLLLVLLAVCVAAAAVLLLKGKKPISEETPPLSVRTNDERVAYLASLGWEVDADPVEALRLTLPEELVEPYRSYNELQLRQGFDLTPLLGETLERYTYAVTNYPGHEGGCQADIYVYDGAVVAGDVICTGADGFIAALDYPEN
ncbi:MAG: DUF4830 domain-containing protein [Oscillospiraceae bacterium]|nr:DUF4830 domain-containing protein [Oscillospiraceae bacterium]